MGLVPDRARREALDAEALGDEPLQGPDGHRRVDRAPPARRLTRSRADAATDRRERVGRPGDEVGVAVAALGDRRDVGTGVGVDRAGGTARLVVPQPFGVRYRRTGHSDQLPILQPAQHPRHHDHDEKEQRVARYSRGLRRNPTPWSASGWRRTRQPPKPTTRMAKPDAIAVPTRSPRACSPAPRSRMARLAHVTVNAARMPRP